jgi:hypothetical protein
VRVQLNLRLSPKLRALAEMLGLFRMRKV